MNPPKRKPSLTLLIWQKLGTLPFARKGKLSSPARLLETPQAQASFGLKGNQEETTEPPSERHPGGGGLPKSIHLASG